MDKALKDKYYAAYVKGVEIRNKMTVGIIPDFKKLKDYVDDVILIDGEIPDAEEFDALIKYINTVADDIDYINKFYFNNANS